MPSCDTGRSGVLVGDEILGFASALLHVGVSTIVAPVIPIPDEVAGPLMFRLHRLMMQGSSPAEAIARIAADAELDSAQRATITAFVAMGA